MKINKLIILLFSITVLSTVICVTTYANIEKNISVSKMERYVNKLTVEKNKTLKILEEYMPINLDSSYDSSDIIENQKIKIAKTTQS